MTVTDRWRTYWRGLVIAAAVSFRQLDSLSGPDRVAESHPFVLVTDNLDPTGFAPAERIGPLVLTKPIPRVTMPSLN